MVLVNTLTTVRLKWHWIKMKQPQSPNEVTCAAWVWTAWRDFFKQNKTFSLLLMIQRYSKYSRSVSPALLQWKEYLVSSVCELKEKVIQKINPSPFTSPRVCDVCFSTSPSAFTKKSCWCKLLIRFSVETTLMSFNTSFHFTDGRCLDDHVFQVLCFGWTHCSSLSLTNDMSVLSVQTFCHRCLQWRHTGSRGKPAG